MTRSNSLCLIIWVLHPNLISTILGFIDDVGMCSNHEIPWHAMLNTTNNILSLQHSQHPDGHRTSGHNVAIVYSNHMWHTAALFQYIISSWKSPSYILDLQLNTKFPSQDIDRVSKVFQLDSYKSKLRTVLIFAEDHPWVFKFIQAVCSNVKYKWTALLHITEWIIVSANSNFIFDLKSETTCLDFVTYITTSGGEVVISRQSRGYIFNSAQEKQNRHEKTWSVAALSHLFTDIYRKRKSDLEGLHLPVGFLPLIPTQSEEITIGNKTTYDGATIALLKALASNLGFTYDLVEATDGGSYGFVTENGSSTGLIGLLARREVAFVITTLHRIDNRLKSIDFSDQLIGYYVPSILYAVPNITGQLDTTLKDIVSSEYYLFLLGPCLVIALIGGLIHVTTKSCTVAAPTAFKKKDLGRLASFPDHMCFQRERKYVGQTGRVLRASWALFFIIFSAAYSAYLVTTFTVKPQELKIDSFEKLLSQTRYRFGINCHFVSLITVLKTSRDDTVKEIWNRLVSFNKTDPWTFSCNSSEHMLKVLEGDYAFVPVVDIVNFQYPDEYSRSRVRNYPLSDQFGLGAEYIGLPFDVFYKDDLDNAILQLDEFGVSAFIRRKYLTDTVIGVEDRGIESKKPVPFSRILLVIYITLGCVGVSVGCLVVEICIGKIYKWF